MDGDLSLCLFESIYTLTEKLSQAIRVSPLNMLLCRQKKRKVNELWIDNALVVVQNNSDIYIFMGHLVSPIS